MSIPAHVIEALTQFIHSSGLGGQAILIGGQAIRDWHASQAHALNGTLGAALPIPRATTDIDVHLAIKDVDPRAIADAITGAWIPDPEQLAGRTFRFMWKQDSSISLDLIALDQPGAKNRIEYLVKIGTGAAAGAVRVLAPWIIRCSLHERSFTPALAQMKVRRLTRLGLVASKLTAVNICVKALVTAVHEKSEPPAWTSRLAKDLQDMDLLLASRIWVDDLWEPHYQPNEPEITRHWAEEAEAFCSLRDRPASVSPEDYSSIQRIALRVPPRLILKAWERES